MRISKAPEERKREMIDTAMVLFAQKGYETTTMTDIAKKMNVVPGLCYRYFKSKEELYKEALNMYAEECSYHIAEIMDRDYLSMEDCINSLTDNFRKMDGKERYRSFFHGKGNGFFHMQLQYEMINILEPHIVGMLERMKSKKIIEVEDCKSTALFIMFGQLPIINDDSIQIEEKISIVKNLITKLVSKLP